MSSTPRNFEAETPFGTFSPNPAQRSLMRLGAMIPAGRYARKMARPLRSLLRRMSHAPIDVTILDRQRMRLHPHGNACETRVLILPHLFDRYELRLLSRVLHPRAVFIDIGANVGIYAIYAALRAGPNARVIAVEPHPLALERLRCNVRLNQLANVAIEPIALSDRSGTVTFRPNLRNIGNSSILAGDGAAPGEPIEVSCESLVDLAARHGLTRIDAIKIDVEGAEDLILFPFFASAPEALWPRLLLIENSADQWRRDCRAMLLERGYRRRKIPSRNLVFWRPAPSP
ncbi:MAG: FkbM family methyltransferase [Methyloceanibacter sp.]